MLFHFSLFSVLLLLFFFHGLVFSVLLFIKGIRRNDPSACWLSFFVILCVLYISPFMLGYAGWYSKLPYREILFYIPFQQLFLIPPVLYFYFKTVLDQSFRFRKTDYLHFIPAAIYAGYSIVVVVTDQVILKEYYFYQDEKDKDFSLWYQLAGFVSLLFYIVRIIRLYKEYRHISQNTLSYADAVRFTWIRQFLIGLSVLLLLRLLFFVINPEWAQFGRKFWYYLSFSILFYGLSIGGYVNTIRSSVSLSRSNQQEEETGSSAVSATNNAEFETSELEETGSWEDASLTEWKNKIEQLLVNERLYEDQTLSVYQLAGRLGTHPKKISQVINQGFRMNFNDYVNQHRVEAVVEKMKAGDHSLQTLLSLSFECGFNSKSTFNRAFRKFTGQTPHEFIRKSL